MTAEPLAGHLGCLAVGAGLFGAAAVGVPRQAVGTAAGLWFVGASTHPGAGVPGVLNSARVLERVVPRPASPVPVELAAK